MFTDFSHIVLVFFIVINAVSVAYMLLAIKSVHDFSPWSSRPPSDGFQPRVTILKPVCGMDVDLYDNLRSFCLQDYPDYQIVHGVRDPNDAAVPVVRKLMAEFPQIDMELVVNEEVCGSNLKVCNLHNMYAAAKHPYLVIADSDTRVGPDYLSAIMAPFENPEVGVVTCPYRGVPAKGLASLLSCMSINERFLPSVLVSAKIRDIRFAMGATMVVRRGLLDDIGGFAKLADNIADDYLLGNLAAEHGYKVVLSDYVIENIIFEKSFHTLLGHELRWAQTIRSMEPVGHAFSFVTHALPTAVFAALALGLVADDWLSGGAIVGLALLLGGLMHFAVRGMLGLGLSYRSLLLGPLRDILSFIVWGFSFFGRSVDWRGSVFSIGKGGVMAVTERTKSR